MLLDFYMPTKIFFGEGAAKRADAELVRGGRALIVTGKRSAILSGAYAEITALLESHGAEYALFDKIGENPLLSVCFEGGKVARECGADFVIGIGGGSPLDAAKAIAAFAANPDVTAEEIYSRELLPSLPLVLVPTTSGTGSEANNYSVLTIDRDNIKKTFKNSHSYADVAIVDPRYTYSLSESYTVSTALDAFCHCIESYLSPKSTDISRSLAAYGGKKLWMALKVLKESADKVCTPSPDDVARTVRRDLMAGSLAGGMAINTTGTGFPHPLGYSLTLNSQIPHGKACAVFIGEYIKKNSLSEAGKARLSEFARVLETTPEEIAAIIPEMSGVALKLSRDERREYVDAVKGAANYQNSPYVISYEEMLDIYDRLFM